MFQQRLWRRRHADRITEEVLQTDEDNYAYRVEGPSFTTQGFVNTGSAFTWAAELANRIVEERHRCTEACETEWAVELVDEGIPLE